MKHMFQNTDITKRKCSIAQFTAVCLANWPLSENEAEVSFLLSISKSCCSYAKSSFSMVYI